MTKELEPCPFCHDGGDPNHFGGAGHHCVKCYECGRTNEKLVLTESDGWHYEAFDSVQDAYDDWNRRYKRTCKIVPMDSFGNPPYYTGDWISDSISDGCSECGYPFDTINKGVPKFCPQCGAEVMFDFLHDKEQPNE